MLVIATLPATYWGGSGGCPECIMLTGGIRGDGEPRMLPQCDPCMEPSTEPMREPTWEP